jgi:hypothetical protein
MGANSMLKNSSIIRRAPLPGEELKNTLELIIRILFEACRKSRDLGREHGRKS